MKLLGPQSRSTILGSWFLGVLTVNGAIVRDFYSDNREENNTRHIG